MALPKFIPQALAQTANTPLLTVIRVINNIQNQLSTILTYLTSKVQNDDVLLQSVQLYTGQSNYIKTTLGRTLSGWQVVGQTNQADVWDNQLNNTNSNYLELHCSADVMVSLLVF